jgi:membrane-bound metal-dependent hydrolase YbcI (DUF457 family)
MDIVHHAAIGAVGFTALAAQGQELAGLGFLAGSVFPDLDVAFMALGKRFYLKRHQGPTHSLVVAPAYAALLALLPFFELGWSWTFFLGALAGLAVHVALDLFNTFGIQIGWPLTRRRFCFDAVFFIDAVAWALTIGALVMMVAGGNAQAVGIAYAMLFAVYLAARLVLQRSVRRRAGADFAIPSAWNPFYFFTFSKRAGRLETGSFDALSGRAASAGSLAESAPDILKLARGSVLFRDMESILRGLHITRVEQEGGATVVVAEDLAIRNFGGKFGRTRLRFDPQGKLLDEMAHI